MSIIALESHIQKLTEDLENSHLMSDVLVDMITDELVKLHAQLYYERQQPPTWDMVSNLELAAAKNAVELRNKRIVKLLRKEIKEVVPGFGQSMYIAGLEKAIAIIKKDK